MARITVEDCLKRIPNRFQLTLAATYRARQLAQGGTPHIETTRDKPTVIALREIAAGKVGGEYLNPVHTGGIPAPFPPFFRGGGAERRGGWPLVDKGRRPAHPSPAAP